MLRVLLICLLLSACGFHLRGHALLPFSQLEVEGSSPLARLLRLQAEQRLPKNTTAPPFPRLQVAEEHSKNILALDPQGKVAEYQLRYRATFRFVSTSQAEQKGDIELRAEFPYDAGATLAKAAEEELLLKNLREEAARRIWRQLESHGAS